MSLPIWTCPLGHDEPGSRWAGMDVDEEGEWNGLDDASPGEKLGDAISSSAKPSGSKLVESPNTPAAENPKGKRKKRTADMIADEEKDFEKRKKGKNGLMSATSLEEKALEVSTLLTEPPARKAKKKRESKAADTQLAVVSPDSSAATITAKENKVDLADAKAKKRKPKVKPSLKAGPKEMLVGRKKLS